MNTRELKGKEIASRLKIQKQYSLVGKINLDLHLLKQHLECDKYVGWIGLCHVLLYVQS